ncbi:hypothetical protein ANACOL_02732 [Anaerotruncus colihominis DSM 17241]|uniref:Uncharacterized protein n=1 Tax=Anaerotruncus colihominis DSM 17241 TaxID=445972 RepID=B0PDU7_9FIRM|nr:hypothetical protein ANACOL_02732 [Anaerotruncus colihominis DSM 17241]
MIRGKAQRAWHHETLAGRTAIIVPPTPAGRGLGFARRTS